MQTLSRLLWAGALLLLTWSVNAQNKVPYTFQYIGDSANTNTQQLLTTVSNPKTTSIRLFFGTAEMGPKSYLLLKGQDGTEQKLDRQSLDYWNNSSAYFNGNSVQVYLHTAQGEAPFLTIDELEVNDGTTASIDPVEARKLQQQAPGANLRDRRKSTVPVNTDLIPYGKAVGRFTNGTQAFGTGWIAPNGLIVTSRRVYKDYLSFNYDVIEFNVPVSNSDGGIQHAAPQDQYPLDKSKVNWWWWDLDFKGAKNDFGLDPGWAVLAALPNSTGQRPGERQKEYFRIASNPSSYILEGAELPMQMLHYGYTFNSFQTSDNKILQISTGTLKKQTDYLSIYTDGSRDKFVIYDVDAFLGSDSGAPVVYEGSNVAIGIHSKTGNGWPGRGVGFSGSDARNDIGDFYSDQDVYADAQSLYTPGTGEIHKPYKTIAGIANAPDNATAFIAKGDYNEAITLSNPITLKAAVGIVRIGTGNNAMASQPIQLPIEAVEERMVTNESVLSVVPQASPNPFTQQTRIQYHVPVKGQVSVQLFDLHGKVVNQLIQDEQVAGQHSVEWNGRDQQGNALPAGVYMVQVRQNNHLETLKLMKQ